MVIEAFRSNVRQEGENSGMVTKTIRSNVDQIVNTNVESKHFTAGQVGQLRFRTLAEFNTIVALKTFSEHKGAIVPEPPAVLIPVTGGVQILPPPPAIELPKTNEQSTPTTTILSEQSCEMCGTRMILASDTGPSGVVQSLFICPKCNHEQATTIPQVQPLVVKVETERPQRGRRRIVLKAK